MWLLATGSRIRHHCRRWFRPPSSGGWIKREHGATYPSGRKTVAAPATVSGALPSHVTGESREGEGRGNHREPGDLPMHEPGEEPMTIPRTERAAMNTTANATVTTTTAVQSLSMSQRLIAGSLALMLGLTLLVGTGFAGDF